jgi:hypothetical protein
LIIAMVSHALRWKRARAWMSDGVCRGPHIWKVEDRFARPAGVEAAAKSAAKAALTLAAHAGAAPPVAVASAVTTCQ